MNFTKLIVATCLGLTGTMAQAASIHDTFSDGTGIIQTDSAPFVENAFSSAEAPGGQRYIANTIGAAVAQPGKFTFAAVQSGAYFAISDPAIPLVTNLTYGRANGFGADLNLDLSTESVFNLDFRYITSPLSVTVTVSTSNGVGANPNVADAVLSLSPSFGHVATLSFSSFLNDAGNAAPINWADIDSISIITSSAGGSAFALDTFSTSPVPEPSTALMVALGLGAIVCRKQTTRKQTT